MFLWASVLEGTHRKVGESVSSYCVHAVIASFVCVGIVLPIGSLMFAVCVCSLWTVCRSGGVSSWLWTCSQPTTAYSFLLTRSNNSECDQRALHQRLRHFSMLEWVLWTSVHRVSCSIVGGWAQGRVSVSVCCMFWTFQLLCKCLDHLVVTGTTFLFACDAGSFSPCVRSSSGRWRESTPLVVCRSWGLS